MKEKVATVLVGMSGYGNVYLREIFSNKNESVYLTGVVDINPKRSDFYQEIVDRNIPIYQSLEQFYEHHQADLAIISTPIHLHKEQSCYAMNHGSHVLCEKPMTANPEDIGQMINTRERTGKFLAIGFNWSFTPSVQELKKDILSGKFGKAKRLKSLVLWPRNHDYYNRSAWAGKEYSPDGEMIFDSVANNATAHFLHHLFYLTGESVDNSAEINQVTTELYKVNPIETFDTCAINVKTKDNVEIFYYASHAVNEEVHPQFVLEFEKATIRYAPGNGYHDVVATMSDGTEKIYTNPELDKLSKLRICSEAIQQGSMDILCGPEAASAHVACIHAMHQSVPSTPNLPEHLKRYEKDRKLRWVEGLGDTLMDCYEKWSLPSDLEVEWSSRGKTVEIKSVVRSDS